MADLGSIYGTTIDGSNTLVIDFSNVQINGTIKLPDSSNNGYGNTGELLTSRGANNTPHWVTPSLTAIRFNGVFNNTAVASGGMPLLDGTRCITGFNADRFTPIGGGWDLINGIFTAPRDCFMNFNFMITAQISASSSEAVILHQRNLVAPFIYEYQMSLMQNTSSSFSFYNFNINGVLFVRAGEIVRVGLKTSNTFTAFSSGRNAAVSFSGYNID